MAEVESAIRSNLDLVTSIPGQLAAIVFSVGALVGRGRIVRVPNGIAAGLTSGEIDYLQDNLVSLPRRLGIGLEPAVIVNDGWLVAMAHADESAAGQTLAIRGGTSLCGGLDDAHSLGEIGWLGLRRAEYCDVHATHQRVPRAHIRARDLLSAESFLAVKPSLRSDYLARALRLVIAEVSTACEVSRLVICGSLFCAVDKSAFLDVFAELMNLSGTRDERIEVSFSGLEDQRLLIARGIQNWTNDTI